MGTETLLSIISFLLIVALLVKLNNPLMGTETSYYCRRDVMY